jgi:general secretion pathway protein I
MMKTKARGFTLVEVMVALMVIAIALPALLKALYQQVDGTAYMRDKSMAQWVASNKMAETRIRLSRDDVLRRGERSGIETLGGRDWYWWTRTEATEVEDFYRIQIDVADAEDSEDSPLFSLVGFLAAANSEGNDS